MNAMHKIPSKFVPKKFALSSKVANTRGTSKCCVGRNPYNGYKYLCGATPSGVFLMQWYDPLNKFMLLKVSFKQFLLQNGLLFMDDINLYGYGNWHIYAINMLSL